MPSPPVTKILELHNRYLWDNIVHRYDSIDDHQMRWQRTDQPADIQWMKHNQYLAPTAQPLAVFLLYINILAENTGS